LHEKLKCLERESLDTWDSRQGKFLLPAYMWSSTLDEAAICLHVLCYKHFIQDAQPNSRWVFSHHSTIQT